MRTGTLPVRTFAALLACVLACAPVARADDAKKIAAAAEKTFADAYAAAGEDEKGRAKAVEGLSTAPDSVKVSVLVDRILPKDESPRVQSAAVAVLRRVKDEDEVKALCAVVKGGVGWDVRGPVFEALGGSDSPLALAALRAVLKSTEPKALASALFALAERHSPDALEDVKKMLVHDAWQVRLGALDYLGRLADRSTLPLLVERLEDEKAGRLRQECVEALKAVTGKDYGADVDQWRAFATGGEDAAKEVGRKAADKTAAGGGRAVATGDAVVEPTYYGEKIYSDRVVFIVDLSLSMNEEMVVDREMIVRETGAVVSGGDNAGGPEKDKPDPKKDGEIVPIEWWKIRTRMDFARSQLKYVVSTLKRDQWFDIVWFSDSIKAWKGFMVPAQPQTKVKAVEWLDSLKCEAGTNTWGGLMKGLNLVGRGTADENYTRGADTLYFLSDGKPSIGDIKDEDQIVAAIERIHKVRHVKIHVVQIGTSRLPFMQRLASVTGGNYKFFNSKGPQK